MQVQSEMIAQGYKVSITKLCHLFGIARRSFYYKSKRRGQYKENVYVEILFFK